MRVVHHVSTSTGFHRCMTSRTRALARTPAPARPPLPGGHAGGPALAGRRARGRPGVRRPAPAAAIEQLARAAGLRPPRRAPATAPSTPWRRTAWPSRSAPTTSSPTWSRPRTACSSPATRTRSPAPPTSPTTPSSPTGATTKTIDGVEYDRVVHRGLHPRRAARPCAPRSGCPRCGRDNTRYDGRFEVPTFAEVLALVKRRGEAHRPRRSASRPRPSTRPTSTPSGLSLEEPMLADLHAARLDKKQSKVLHPVLRGHQPARARPAHDGAARAADLSASGAPYDQVVAGTGVTYADLVTRAGLRGVAQYADWVGPDKAMVLPRRRDRRERRADRAACADAHRGGPEAWWSTRSATRTSSWPPTFRRGDRPERQGRRLRRDHRLPRRRRGRVLRRLPRLRRRRARRLARRG